MTEVDILVKEGVYSIYPDLRIDCKTPSLPRCTGCISKNIRWLVICKCRKRARFVTFVPDRR